MKEKYQCRIFKTFYGNYFGDNPIYASPNRI